MGMPTRSPKPTPHTTRDPTACCNDSRVMAIPAFAIAKIGTATKLAQPCNRCSSHSTVDTDDFASRTVMAACPTSDTSASSSWSMSSWRVNGCVGASRPMTTPASVGWTLASYKVHQSTTPRAPYTPIAVHPPRRRTTTVTMASAAAINSASAARKSRGGRTIDRRTGVGHIVEHFTGLDGARVRVAMARSPSMTSPSMTSGIAPIGFAGGGECARAASDHNEVYRSVNLHPCR